VALKHVAVLTVYKILFIYMCCAFVGLDNRRSIVTGLYQDSTGGSRFSIEDQ
jgi:hypothetical protein